MSGKRKDAFSEVIVGIFMLAVMALLVYFTVIISGVDVLHGRRRVMATVAFSDVGGLKDHDNVMYRGTKVGSVGCIRLTQEGLQVLAEIDHDVVLREGYRISVCDLSMLGGHYLLLEEGEGEILPLDGTVFNGESPVDLGRTVTRVARRLDEIMTDPKLTNIVARIDSAASDLASVVSSVREGKGTVGKLLSSDDTVYTDLQSTLTNLSVVTTRVKEGKGLIGKLLSEDDAVYNDLQRTISSAADLAERLKRGEGLAGRLFAKDDSIAHEVEDAVKAFRKACDSLDMTDTLTGANRLLDSLNVVAAKLRDGEGTIGKLVAQDELYNEVQGLTKDVRQVIDNFRDTTPISTFGSLIMGGL